MIKDFTNILNCENKLCWMLSWHKNKYYTGKQKYFLSRHEVHLYFIELLRRMCSYSLIFMLNQTQEGGSTAQRKWELKRKWHHSLCSLSPSTWEIKEPKKERDRKRAWAFIRWAKGWLNERIQNGTSDYCDHLSSDSENSFISSRVQHQWLRGHACFHHVSPVLLSASLDGPQSESRLPEEQSELWGSAVGQNHEFRIFIGTLGKNFFRTSFQEHQRPSSSPLS